MSSQFDSMQAPLLLHYTRMKSVLSISLSVCLSISLFVCLPMCQSVSLSISIVHFDTVNNLDIVESAVICRLQTPSKCSCFLALYSLLQSTKSCAGAWEPVYGLMVLGVCWGSETSDTLQDADSKKGM